MRNVFMKKSQKVVPDCCSATLAIDRLLLYITPSPRLLTPREFAIFYFVRNKMSGSGSGSCSYLKAANVIKFSQRQSYDPSKYYRDIRE